MPDRYTLLNTLKWRVAELPACELLSIRDLGLITEYILQNSGDKESTESLVQRGTVIALERCRTGRPLGHLLGEAKFLGRWFSVSSDILVPHPATEVLALLAISLLRSHPTPVQKGIELGFGCGALSISLLIEYAQASICASDLTEEHVRVSKANALHHLGTDHQRFQPLVCSEPSETIEPFFRAGLGNKSIDFILANPPYLMLGDDISPEYRDHMPASAIYARNNDPCDFYRQLAVSGIFLLRPGGLFIAEARTSRVHSILTMLQELSYVAHIYGKDRMEDVVDLSELDLSTKNRRFSNHRFIVAHR